MVLTLLTSVPNGVLFVANPAGTSTLRSFAILVLHFFELRIHDVVATRAPLCSATGSRRRRTRASRPRTGPAGRTLLGGIGTLGDCGGCLCKCLSLLLDYALVIALQCGADVRDSRLNTTSFGWINLVTQVLQGLLYSVNHAVRFVPCFNQLTEPLVFLGMSFRVTDHPLDLVLVETAGGLDDDLLLLAGGLVLRGHIQNTVRVDVEGHFDLRQPARCRRDIREITLTEGLVIQGPIPLTLQHVNRDRRLIVIGRGEGLRRLGGNRRVLLDQLRHHTAEGFDTQRQRSDVEQQNVLYFAREHASLNCRTDRDSFIRIDVLTRLLAKEVLHVLLYQ